MSKPKQQMSNKQIAICGVLLALAIILSYLESLIPINVIVPGIKVGIANIVTIIALKKIGLKEAIIISVGRIIVSGILFGNVTTIIYSLAGAALSLLVMYLVSKLKFFTTTGVSICGAIAHNVGQIIVAVLVFQNIHIAYYLIVLVIAGTIFGTIIGIIAGLIMKRIKI